MKEQEQKKKEKRGRGRKKGEGTGCKGRHGSGDNSKTFWANRGKGFGTL